MSRLFYHTMQDNAGNLLFGVSGTMRLAGSGTLATIYGDEALTIIISNPMTNHPSFGSFKCFLGAGDYDFYMAKAGYTFETLTGVQGHGTMAQQNASGVAITGGSATGLGQLQATNAGFGVATAPSYTLVTGPGYVSLADNVVIGGATAIPNARLDIEFSKATHYGLRLRQLTDTGAVHPLLLSNAAGTEIGSISSTGSAVAFNTTSDGRLKTAVQTLVGELAVIRALRPVRFRWLSDDAPGVGFIAGEVAEHVQGVITGEPDAVEEDGVTIRPQQIDHSKLVPWLVGALQTLAAQVDTLTERVAELEAGLGV
jgi:hypothetical protein